MQLRLEHDPVRSAKRKMVVVQKKINLTKRDGQHLMPERPFPFIQPTATNEGVCQSQGKHPPREECH